MKEKRILFFSILTITTIIKNFIFSSDLNTKDDCVNKYKCSSSGLCVDSYSQCPTPIDCGDLKKINQYTCARKETYEKPKLCGKYTCWNNKCVENKKDCPNMSTCPSKYLVKCHDNSCVDNIKNCPRYINCPKFIPVRCPNGDCRQNLEDCPSLIKCPNEYFTILCNDNSCRETAESCEKPSENTKCNGSMIRCSDGTCKSSKFLCSTPKTCPVDMVLCFNGICASNNEDCSKIEANKANTCSNGKIRCDYDGTCRDDINDCPTGVICPVEKPVRCWDNSCKENVFKCSVFKKCPKNSIECPNGTCLIKVNTKDNNINSSTCGTLITCSFEAPFKCRDNTCKRNPNDCDNLEECPFDKPILCWDGSCVASRIECIGDESCSPNTPVKCPDNQCRKKVEECKEIQGCPIGFIRCSNGKCKRKSSDCIETTCPVNFPNLCFNGICVKNKNDCERENGCPFYFPNKCPNGRCVKEEKDCINEDIQSNDNKNSILCKDGSFAEDISLCPLANGCDKNRPILCGNGECRTSCKIPVCPKETPIKCLNGLCVLSGSNCPSSYNFSSISLCESLKLISCANGLCAKYPEECKPASQCPKGYAMCNDGSCRLTKEQCPVATGCPEGKYRCPNGACENEKKNCLGFNGCPEDNKIKCSNNGLCVKSQEDCAKYDKLFPLGNGCDQNVPFKCPITGKCAMDKDSCEESLCVNNKFYCPNSGECVDFKNDCKISKCKFFTCPTDGKCVENLVECKTLQSCPSYSPYRCIDGSCKKLPFSFNTNQVISFCQKRIECPSYRPYLCADGSCMEKSIFCRSLLECPTEKKIRCPDRTCVSKFEDCENSFNSDNCPSTNPILCSSNSNCVKNYFDCFDEKCPKELPFKCISGICVNSPRECVYKFFASSNNLKNENSFISKTITKCKDGDNTCFDGSCRDDINDCPIYEGCKSLLYPYKCPSGKCSKDFKSCFLDIYGDKLLNKELLEVDCESNKTLCNDGICRTKCPISNSCDNKNPFLCSNGVCVKDINECAGESKCIIGKPFRCVDGTCVNEPSKCITPLKLESSTDLKIFVFPYNEIETNILINDSNDIIGSIFIPSNTFSEKIISDKDINRNKTLENNNNELYKPGRQIISIRSLPTRSPIFSDTYKKYNDNTRDIVNKLFPYGDRIDSLMLQFDYAILSPVLEIKFEMKETTPTQNILLNLAYDLQYEFKFNDNLNQTVCLAYLNITESKEWNCTETSNIFINDMKDFKFTGFVNKPGYYAVALNLNQKDDILSNDVDWIILNFRYFVIIIVSALILLFLFIYVFLRFLRYRKKYIKTKSNYIEMEKKEASMKEKSINFKGQTILDTEENMIYTDNPCKEEKLNEINESRKIRMGYLNSLEDSYFHKIKVSEANNEKLNEEIAKAYERYNILKEYAEDILKEPEKLIVTENE